MPTKHAYGEKNKHFTKLNFKIIKNIKNIVNLEKNYIMHFITRIQMKRQNMQLIEQYIMYKLFKNT